MKQQIADLLAAALNALVADGAVPADLSPEIHVERTRDKSHGDFASNLAMALAKPARANPRQLAEKLIAALPASPAINKVEIAGPGFINFHVNESAMLGIVADVLGQGEAFGRCEAGKGERVQVEFVSANPTGPLHVGHGRGAAYGACLANLLRATGHQVHAEYYINDAGRQMDILGASVWLRYLQACGEELVFPSNGYQGVYVADYGRELHAEVGDALRFPAAEVFAGVPADAPEGGDKELHIDGLIERAKTLLGPERYRKVFDLGLNKILADIRQDLAEFGVVYDEWFSERSLTEGDCQVSKAIELLRANGFIEERDGAQWFLSTRFGDDKDRVVRRENGQTTYFASDIAYHLNKFQRGFDRVIDLWGADHHGYIARVKAALQAMTLDPDKLTIRLVQFVSLFRNGEAVAMSTRSGSFVTLRELREEVGNDAARFFYIIRKAEMATDFDLELAKSQSKDNPVYYIQYAHARVSSMLRKLAEQGMALDREQGLARLDLLVEEQEKTLFALLPKYPEVVLKAARELEPHLLATYLKDLAGEFHAYYNTHKVLGDDAALRNARIALSLAVQQVIRNGLQLLGVSAPEAM